MSQLPFFYYPTTLYWIDDDSIFLSVATDRYKSEHAINTACSPSEAIHFFSQYQPFIKTLQILRGCEEYEDYDSANHFPVDLDFSEVRRITYNPAKLKDIAVMIVDYQLPEMSGIELCEKLSSIPAKKILLTGNADLQDAINAFNKGVINCFICKDDLNIDTILTESVNKLSMEYFVERTAPLLHHLESDYKLPHSDPIFSRFFNQLCRERRIEEYYLCDKNGGVLLVDSEKKAAYLVVHTERSLDNFIELHSTVDDVVFFVKSVRNRTKIPFFGVGKEMWGPEAELWSQYFYSPCVLEGREKYYWTLIPLK